MKEVVITSAVRTPNGSFGGSLSKMSPVLYSAIAIEEAIKRSAIEKDQVDEVIMGMVLPCGHGQNPARLASINAGLPWNTGCMTINKVCGSALKAIMLGAQAIQAGDADVVVAGGMENMSMAPFYLDKARFGYRMGTGSIQDHLVHDGLWDVVNDFHMGISNELCCEKYKISREDQDRYAERSFTLAMKSIRENKFIDEIVPVAVPRIKGDPKIFSTDECPRETTYETLSKLPPVFKKDGVTTAGNSSPISDGASAVVLMSKEKAEQLSCEILVSIGAQASAGIDMKYVLVAPIVAIPRVLKKEGITIKDVDFFEINEAFAGSTLAVIRELGLDLDRVNVNGGSIALGHPIGSSGTRVFTTMINEMRRKDKTIGLVTLCLGGGEAVALIVKRS
jgi:acetyl-CoA C-acetyltransferase